MREILFRAKSKNYRLNVRDKHWVYGSLVRGEVLFPEKKEEYFIVELRNRGDCTYEVEPETLCQYTGLKDKNGNRIWENDIVRIENSVDEGVGNIEFYGGMWYVDGEPSNSLYDILEYDDIAEIEVIGNIFDNPELMKE